jgi:hypothetical protein
MNRSHSNFEVLFRHITGGTEQYQKKRQVKQLGYGLTFETRRYRIRGKKGVFYLTVLSFDENPEHRLYMNEYGALVEWY